MDDQPNTDEKHSFNPMLLTAWTMLAVFFYFLSTGPLVYLYGRGMISDSAIDTLGDTLYAPIVWLTDQSPWFEQVFRGYLDLWE